MATTLGTIKAMREAGAQAYENSEDIDEDGKFNLSHRPAYQEYHF